MVSLEKVNIAPCDTNKPRLSLQLKKKKPKEEEKKADVGKERFPLIWAGVDIYILTSV